MSRTIERPLPRPRRAALCLPLLLGATVFALPPGDGEEEEPPIPETEEYDKLTNSWFSVTNFNVETVRGFRYGPWADDGSNVLYALNTHRSSVRRYRTGVATAEVLWPTVHNPISLAVWEPGPDSQWRTEETDHLVIVVGGATHAVVAHVPHTGSPDDGAMKALLPLPSEPQDIVIDAGAGKAYVSCAGTQEVVRFDLETFTEEARYFIPAPRPKFMALREGKVYVAPEISGNNTTNAFEDGMAVAVDLYDTTVYPPTSQAVGKLSDDDLYAIDPGTGSVAPVVQRAGVILQEFAWHPSGGWWMLNIDSANADPTRRTEPSLKGDFAKNRLTIVSGGTATSFQDLDAGAGVKSIASPWALDFHSSGFAAIVGSTSDRLRICDPSGNRVGEVDLPPGSIPRDVEFIEDDEFVLVYCWGSNRVLTYGTAQILSQISTPQPGFGPVLERDLGVDPLPERVRNGRATFYSAVRSSGGTTGPGAGGERLTCGTCHPGGRTDQLVWNIGDIPHDFKDGMLTQSLMGLLDTFPFHWRGERDLSAFNVAFAGLLGGTELSEDRTAGPSELDEFEAFVFSMLPPANPLEDPERVLSNSIRDHARPNGLGGRATVGQAVYQQPGTLFGFSCVQCHSLETGSNGLFSADEPFTLVPGNRNMDVTHLRQLASRFLQEEVALGTIFSPTSGLQLGASGVLHNTRGFGFSHDGDNATVFRFLTPTQLGGGFTLTAQEWSDVTTFVEQFDSGMAPRAHAAYLLDQAGAMAGVDVLISQELIPQASQLWLDVAVLGTVTDSGGSLRRVQWWWDPASAVFRANDPAVQIGTNPPGTVSLSELATQASLGQASNVVLGLPPGNGRRFAGDPDNDGLLDGEEWTVTPTPTLSENPDCDDDGFPDGHEVANLDDPWNATATSSDTTAPTVQVYVGDHTAGSFAKVLIEFSEPVSYTIQAKENGTPVGPVQHRVARRERDTLFAHHLLPSLNEGTPPLKDYTFEIEMEDFAGVPGTATLSGLEKARRRVPNAIFTPPALSIHLVPQHLEWMDSTAMNGSTLNARAFFSVSAPEFPGVAPTDFRVLFSLAVYDASAQTWDGAPSFTSPEGHRVDALFLNSTPTVTAWDPTPTVSDVFLVSPPMTASGSPGSQVAVGEVRFDVPNLAVNDVVELNIAGILKEDPVTQPPNPPPSWIMLEAIELPNYLMPETDPEVRRIDFQVP